MHKLKAKKLRIEQNICIACSGCNQSGYYRVLEQKFKNRKKFFTILFCAFVGSSNLNDLMNLEKFFRFNLSTFFFLSLLAFFSITLLLAYFSSFLSSFFFILTFFYFFISFFLYSNSLSLSYVHICFFLSFFLLSSFLDSYWIFLFFLFCSFIFFVLSFFFVALLYKRNRKGWKGGLAKGRMRWWTAVVFQVLMFSIQSWAPESTVSHCIKLQKIVVCIDFTIV